MFIVNLFIATALIQASYLSTAPKNLILSKLKSAAQNISVDIDDDNEFRQKLKVLLKAGKDLDRDLNGSPKKKRCYADMEREQLENFYRRYIAEENYLPISVKEGIKSLEKFKNSLEQDFPDSINLIKQLSYQDFINSFIQFPKIRSMLEKKGKQNHEAEKTLISFIIAINWFIKEGAIEYWFNFISQTFDLSKFDEDDFYTLKLILLSIFEKHERQRIVAKLFSYTFFKKSSGVNKVQASIISREQAPSIFKTAATAITNKLGTCWSMGAAGAASSIMTLSGSYLLGAGSSNIIVSSIFAGTTSALLAGATAITMQEQKNLSEKKELEAKEEAKILTEELRKNSDYYREQNRILQENAIRQAQRPARAQINSAENDNLGRQINQQGNSEDEEG